LVVADVREKDLMPTDTNTETLAAAQACWSCRDMRAAQFCKACGKVQPPVAVDYFTFFDLRRKLNLDLSALEREFYSLSRKLHPDLYTGSDAREQGWSLQQSSRLNDAYRTLKDPIRRTEYLLRLEGVELEGQSKAATEEARNTGQKKQIVPPDLLEEVFELNMQLEELRANKKMGDADPALAKELEEQKSTLEGKFRELSDELTKYWKQWDAAEDSGNEIQKRVARDKMVDLLNRRSYIRNLVRDVREVLES
jgi:molecular chaperone HscB